MLNPEFNHLYFSSYPRLSSFLLGMVLGLVIEHLKQKKYKLPPVKLSLNSDVDYYSRYFLGFLENR